MPNIGRFEIVRPLIPYLRREIPDVKANQVRYKSGLLNITSWLYLPPTNPPTEPQSDNPIDRPAPKGAGLVVGHGGIWGVPAHYDIVLRRLAAAGWTIAAPGFRGEDDSDGEVEFGLGESDDMLNCWKALTELPEVDRSRTWLLGSSHGAMAALRGLGSDEIPEDLPGAIAGWGVYDLGKWLDWLERVDHPILAEPFIIKLLKMDDRSIGARSDIKLAGKIKKPVLLLHGNSDTLVPYAQTVNMANAFDAAGKTNYEMSLESTADHEYIWGPERGSAIRSWERIMQFVGSSPL